MHDSVDAVLARQQAFFATGATLDPAFRRSALQRLQAALEKHSDALLEALRQDLGKSYAEGWMTELGIVLSELRGLQAKLKRWTRTRHVSTPLMLQPGRAWVHRDPWGVVAILAPWNYPVQLCLVPLIGALACGNCVVLKPSREAPATAQALETLLHECFETDYVAVVRGDRHASQALVRGACDHVFFTGSPAVGREIMRMASERLTPVTLELGGKSPCLILPDADLALAARRIAWGKLLNAGQTCVAPDTVLVPRALEEAFIRQLAEEMARQMGTQPLQNPEFPRIVNERHYDRLMAYLSEGRIAHGGQGDRALLRIAPTILANLPDTAPVMLEEVFGPILPIRTYETVQEAIAYIRARPKPLACYVFSKDTGLARALLRRLPFGGGCVNDCVMHVSHHHLPFGGVGDSGMGQYHGRDSIACFSRPKGVYQASRRIDLPLRYPPYAGKLGLFRRFVR